MALDLFSCMKSFIAIAEYGNFNKAAQHLYITPPVLTKQIQKLESYAGKLLFERSTRVVNLTEAGKLYLSHAEQILNSIDNAKNVLYDLEVEPHGKLKIGVPGMFDYSPFNNIFQEFLELYPKISLEIVNETLPSNLTANTLDIMISELNISDLHFNKEYLYTVERSILASPEYIKKHGKPKTISELKQHNCLIYINATPTHEWVFNNKKVKVFGNYISNSFQNIVNMAIIDLGLIWVPRVIFNEHIKTGQLINIEFNKFSSKRDMWVYSLPTHDLNIKLMNNHLKKSFKSVVPQLM